MMVCRHLLQCLIICPVYGQVHLFYITALRATEIKTRFLCPFHTLHATLHSVILQVINVAHLNYLIPKLKTTKNIPASIVMRLIHKLQNTPL